MRIVYSTLFISWFISVGVLAAQDKPYEVVLSEEYRRHFDRYSVKGSVMIFDLKGEKAFYFDKERTANQYSPASTFKIFNALVGLETGVIPDTSYVIPWDSVRRGNYAAWNRSNSLKSAFRYSVVWYYQELARRVGEREMQRFISDNHYGNENIGDRIDAFWLSDMGGQLRISQQEQIAFLKRLYHEELNFSKRSQQLVKAIMLTEDVPEYRLYAKTGMCSQDGLWYGWYVGWVEVPDNVYFFATHIESDDTKKILAGARQGVTKGVLKDLGVLKNEK